MNKAVFLDRDGVINKKMPEDEYVTNWTLFEFLPEVKEGLKKLANSEYRIIIVTNQRGVARGRVNLIDLEKSTKNSIIWFPYVSFYMRGKYIKIYKFLHIMKK